MSLSFPSNPVLNQIYTYSTKTWVWNGSAWDLQSTGAINGIPIGNVIASTGNFTTLTGDSVNSLSGVFVGGNTQNSALDVTAGNSAFSLGQYTLSPGQSGTLGASATQNIFNKDISIVSGPGVQVVNTANTVTISANTSNISITNSNTGSVLYPLLVSATTGNVTAVQTANAFLTYTPATGNLTVGNLVSSSPLSTQSGGTGKNRFIAGQDYVAPAVPSTISATQVFAGAGANISFKFLNSAELMQIVPVGLTGTYNFYIAGGAVQYATANAVANWQMNFGWNGANTLNSVMSIGDSMSAAVLATQGASAFYPTTFRVDGTAVTPRWQGGSAPSSGNANGIDSYVFTIIKTNEATFVVLASQTRFA